MKPVDPQILEFIREHHVLTLAVAKDNIPWCAHCFYVYVEDRNCFFFTSDEDTRHIRDVETSGNYQAGGAIALETRMVGKIRGIQFSGKLFRPQGEELAIARKAYLKRFPIARLTDLSLWGFEPAFIKLTDNRLGFGKKLIWDPLQPNN